MIICEHCGHENPLGTLYCRACGEKLGVGASSVMAGVSAGKDIDRLNKAHSLARSALALSGVLLFVGLAMTWFIEPDLPDITLPIYSPSSPQELLEKPVSLADWRQQDDERIAAILDAEKQKLDGGKVTTVEWRRAEGVRLLQQVGLPVEAIAAWQAVVMDGQNDNGSYDGPDPSNLSQRYATTALVAMACLIFPHDEAALLHGNRAADYVASKARFIRTTTNKTVRNLMIAALLVAGRAKNSDLAFYRSLLVDGGDPETASWAIAFFEPGEGPRSYAQLTKMLRQRALYVAVLDLQRVPADRQPMAKSLLDDGAVQSFNAWDRVLWGLATWQNGFESERSVQQMIEWAQSGDGAVPETLAQLTGDKATLALRVLAACAPAQLPPITEAISPGRL